MTHDQNKKTILVVEDKSILCRSLIESLRMAGFNVLEAKDGEEGLSSALEHNPDLILLDILLPKMDGLTMLRKLREDGRWRKNTPVIFLTNLGDASDISKAVEQGVFTYLVKADWTLTDVVKKVKEKMDIK